MKKLMMETPINAKKMAAVASAILLGTVANGDSVWQYNTPDPARWFTPAAWTVYPPSGNVTLLKKANSSIANIYLEKGDDVTVKGVDLCNSSYKGGNLFFQVQKGASLTFTGNMLSDAESFTNVIDIAGGTVRGNTFRTGGKPTSPTTVFVTNGADVAFASMTQSSGGPASLYIEDSTFAVTNSHFMIGPSSGTDATRMVGKKAVISQLLAGLYISFILHANSQLLLEDSTLTVKAQNLSLREDCAMRLTNTVVSAQAFSMASSNAELELVGEDTSVKLSGMTVGNSARYVQRGGTLKVSRNQNVKDIFMTSSSATEAPQLDIYGGTLVLTNLHKDGGANLCLAGEGECIFRQHGGTVMTYGAFFKASGEKAPRCKIYGGKFFAHGYKGNEDTQNGIRDYDDKVTKSGVFSIYGGAPEVRLQYIGTAGKTARQPQIDFIICTNGCPTIYLDKCKANWTTAAGYFTIRPLGGVQLMHGNGVTLLDGTPTGREINCQNLNEGGTLLPNAALWQPGATTQTLTVKVTLKEDAELADGAYYAEGKSCGYLKIPRVGENWRTASVHLDLVPRGDETLDTLVAGFTAAGYEAKRINGTYNVKLRIPCELLVDGSADEKILIDFNEYADAEAVRDAQPTVRALVRRARFVHDPGLVLFLR